MENQEMLRGINEQYPDYTAEIEAINKEGVTVALLQRIINKHRPNMLRSKSLYNRYQALNGCVPIFNREPRFNDSADVINNKVNNDYFSEIIDFKVGYFAGVPISYSYSDTLESKEDTADIGDTAEEAEEARDEASKALSDFIARNNMFDVDMEVTKYASICGYAGRLLYHDPDGEERVMAVAPFETIILSETGNISEPTYAIRYYKVKDINDKEILKVEFYDSDTIQFYEGHLSDLVLVGTKPNLYGYCPLQGIQNNKELTGDAEKVIALIDAYDKSVSDMSNEVESFANSYMVFENVNIDDDEIRKAQASGAIKFYSGASQGKVYFLTKDNSGTFIENHLKRLEENIYRFSKTPNLSDSAFGTASGVALKFKLTGLEAKCGMFQAKMITAGNYMFKAWAGAMAKKQIKIDPLQCIMEFKRNFPLDILSEAQACQQLIAAGLPKRLAYQIALSAVDDIDYVMQLIEEEQNGIPSLLTDLPTDLPENNVKDFEPTEQVTSGLEDVKEDTTLTINS